MRFTKRRREVIMVVIKDYTKRVIRGVVVTNARLSVKLSTFLDSTLLRCNGSI